jgi:DNA repair exonuclease SbcCD ATPase subunit
MGVEELSKKWEVLKKKRTELVSKRDKIKGRLEAEKEQLKKIVDEIKAMGIEPKDLAKVLKEREEKIQSDLVSFEAAMLDAESKLKKFDEI